MSKANKLKLSIFSFIMIFVVIFGLTFFVWDNVNSDIDVSATTSINYTFTTGENDDITVVCECDIDPCTGTKAEPYMRKIGFGKIISMSSAGTIDLNDFVDAFNVDYAEYEDYKLTYIYYFIGDGTKTDVKTKFTGVIIPNTVEDMKFGECTNLQSVIFEPGSKITELHSLSSCKNLTTITIPKSVIKIRDSAFGHCTSMQTVMFEEDSHLQIIDNDAFEYCSNLTTITIPDSVISIGDYAFEYCSSLSNLIISENSKLVKCGSAFDGCTSLEYVDTENNFTYIKTTTNNYFYLSSSQSGSHGTAVVNSSCKFIRHHAFKNCGASSVSIPDTVILGYTNVFDSCPSSWLYTEDGVQYVKTTENNYFYAVGRAAGCGNVLNIHSGCKFIGYRVDWNTDGNINEVIIPDGVIGIGAKAFYGTDPLKHAVQIPSSVKYIFSYAFRNKYVADNLVLDNLIYIDDYAFEIGSGADNMTFSDALLYIGERAFQERVGLTSITIPNSSKYIGMSAFSGCEDLTNVDMPDELWYLGPYAFSRSGITSIEIPEGIFLRGETFYFCKSLESVTIPSSIKCLDCSDNRGYNNNFSNCKNWVNLYYEGTLEEWFEIEGGAFYADAAYVLETPSKHFYLKDASGNYQELTELVIPASVKIIKEGAFCGCNNITKVTFHDDVKMIAPKAFFMCTSIERVESQILIKITCFS